MKKIISASILILLMCMPAWAANLEMSNFGYGTLASALGTSDTTLTVTYNSLSDTFPTSGKFRVLVFSASCSSPASCTQREIIELDGSATTTFTISQRGSAITDSDSGTTTQAWVAGDKIWGAITAEYTHSQLQSVNELPDLTQNYLWRGDSSSRPVAVANFGVPQLPDLLQNYIWIGDASARPFATQDFPLASLDSDVYFTDHTDSTKHLLFDLSNIPTSTTHTMVVTYRGALVHLSANQSIPTLTDTNLAFDVEDEDTSSIHDNVTNNTRLTVPTGVTRVRLIANVEWAASTSGTYRSVAIIKNGVRIYGLPLVRSALISGVTIRQNLTSYPISCTAGDYFELQVYQNAGTLDVTSAYTWFGMEVIE